MATPSYSKGFESLKKEFSATNIPVNGNLPEWLRGELIRTGPAKFEVGKKKFNHWFDGHALLYKFSISNGMVNFHSKFLSSYSYKEAIKKNTLSRAEFGTDPCYSIFGRFMSFFSNKRTDNCNVNVSVLQGKTVVMTETPLTLAFDSASLNTGEHLKYSDKLDGQMTTAHPHYDSKRKVSYNYLLKFGPKSKYIIYKLAEDSRERIKVGEIETRLPSYLHSFGMSENYLILALFPLTVFPLKLKFKVKPVVENYEWKPEQKLKFYLIHKDTGKIERIAETDAYFGFHHINAFETKEGVHCDICVQENADAMKTLYLKRLSEGNLPEITGEIRRFLIPFDSAKPITHSNLADVKIELPRINYGIHAGRNYNFVYGCSISQPGDFIDTLVKVDLQRRSHLKWMKKGHYPGEPIFIASPGATKEDEGVILSIVLNSDLGTSYLLVLDAETFKELASARLPEHIPFGFHGQFFSL